MIEAGTHVARCIDKALGVTDNGKEQIVMRFRFEGGVNDGQEITHWGYFSGGAIEITLKAMRACGWKGDNIGELGAMDQPVSLVIAPDTYEGKTSMRVRWINPMGNVEVKNQLAGNQLSSFAARMRAHAQKIPEVASVAPRRASAPDAGGFDGPPPDDADFF